MAILEFVVVGVASLLCLCSPPSSQDEPRNRSWQPSPAPYPPIQPPDLSAHEPDGSAYERERQRIAEWREVLKQNESRRLAEQQKVRTQDRIAVGPPETPRPPQSQPRPESTTSQPRQWQPSNLSIHPTQQRNTGKQADLVDQGPSRRDPGRSSASTNLLSNSTNIPSYDSTSTSKPLLTHKTTQKQQSQSDSLSKPSSQKPGPSQTPAAQPPRPSLNPPIAQTKSDGKKALAKLRVSPAPESTSAKRRKTSIVEDDRDDRDRQADVGDELRQRAAEEYKLVDKFRKEAKEARRRGQHSSANIFHLKAEEHRRKMIQWNKEASDTIFQENNQGRNPGVIDLHGLHVEEAIERAKNAVEAAIEKQDPEINLIVGKGNHSRDSIAKVKPGIEKWLSDNGFTASLDRGGGMFVVNLRDQISNYYWVLGLLSQLESVWRSSD
ncbi:hypothetical protein FRC03_004278 [Tulasnella sp. 419]|nr:hypothetical protein FRC03_004278 [Tulasnella sp. 419]